MDEGQREVEAPPHPARVAADPAVGRLGEADALDQLVAAGAALALGDAVERRLQSHVLAGGQMGVERGLLQGGADRLADLPALGGDVVAADAWPCPSVGGSSVVSISTVVDLPAPFGPRKP